MESQRRQEEGRIVLRLRGGLGNQIFQYAAARQVAVRNSVPLYLDAHTGFQDDPYRRSYALDIFDVKATVLPADEAKRFRCRYGRNARLFAFAEKVAMRLQGKSFFPHIREMKVGSPTYLEGYFQSPRYFDDIETFLREDLRFKEPPEVAPAVSQAIRESDSICVHVRRLHGLPNPGDVGSRREVYGLGADYYLSALSQLVSRLSRPHLFIFGDRTEWFAEHVRVDCSYTLVTGQHSRGDLADFLLMSRCKHHVIANSTFSWWAAWLCEHADKIVFAPHNFSPSLQRPYRDIYLSTWNVIRVVS